MECRNSVATIQCYNLVSCPKADMVPGCGKACTTSAEAQELQLRLSAANSHVTFLNRRIPV